MQNITSHIVHFNLVQGIIKDYHITGLQDMVKKKKIAIILKVRISDILHVIISVSQFSFSLKKPSITIMMIWPLLWSVPNKHVFLHLENKICRPGTSVALVLHYNAVCHTFSSKNCSFCDLDIENIFTKNRFIHYQFIL